VCGQLLVDETCHYIPIFMPSVLLHLRHYDVWAFGAVVRQLGIIFTDRGSKYAVSGCKVTNRAEIDATLKKMKSEKTYAKATHNTWGVLINGVPLKSDDGESGAGIVILRMLERADRQNELIIVSRWYGGKHLGGDRFRHVQDATRDYLEG